MKIPLYQVDAFAERPFTGNPAAVCPLDAWLPKATMQAIAAENNLSETAYLVPERTSDADFHLRWFTPAVEVDLCGHATLASAFVVFHREPGRDEVRFQTASGPLHVARRGELLEMALPNRPGEKREMPAELAAGLGGSPVEVLCNADYWFSVYESQSEVAALAPDFRALAEAGRGLIATAPGDDDGTDFVSRMFAPYAGIDEDPVCGSAHCFLTPYWAERLGKTTLAAEQISARGGRLACSLEGDRVLLGGKALLYLEGAIEVPGA